MDFLNEKNSLSLKQLFVLHGNPPYFLHALPLKAGPSTEDATLLRSLRWVFTSNSEAHLSPPAEDRHLVEKREEIFAFSREEEKAV